jgi:putative serine protease PepD
VSTEYEGGSRSDRPDEAAGGGSAPAPPTAPPTAPPPSVTPASTLGVVPPSPPAPGAPWGAVPQPPPPNRRSGMLAGVVAATLIAGGIGGGVGYLVADGEESTSTTVSADDDGDEAQARPPESVAGIAEEALSSVVTIETGAGMEATTGTGFVFDEQGRIMTNNHVVAAADEGAPLTATFSDGESYEADVVGRAEGYDVAVIELTDAGGRELDPLPMGDSEEVVVGDATVAIGAPFGLDGTVTTGIISALDRPVASSESTGATASSYMNALQTDASINPGNSGGPLLNADGEVVGVNSAILGQSGSIGLGFAIPINQALNVAGDLVETGEPVYAIIGAHVDTGETTGGAQIIEPVAELPEPITPGGPADEAGLEPGDVIVRFGERPIDSGPTLISEIWTYQPGDRVEVTYERGGQEQTTEVVLGERVGDETQ